MAELDLERTEKRAVLEVLCVFFWFLFDGFWLMEWAGLTYIGSFISLLLAIVIFFYLEREPAAILIAMVDTLWLLMNIFWAIFDFTKLNWTHEVAKICFLLGAIFFVLAFMVGKTFQLVLRRLRIFKFLFAKN